MNKLHNRGMAKCKMSGHCCTRIPIDILETHAETKEEDIDEKHRSSLRIVKEWIKSTPKDALFVTCNHLTKENKCDLHGKNKPRICSHSLSEDFLSHPITPNKFFHVDCGYLRGAPWWIKAGVIAVMDLSELKKTPILSEQKYMLLRSIASDLNPIIVNGNWVWGSYKEAYKRSNEIGASYRKEGHYNLHPYRVKRFPRKLKKKLMREVEKRLKER